MLISVENLNYRYPGGDTNAVEAVNFSIAEGEIFGFLGPSGAGKSTTQKLLTGLLKADSGMIRIFGEDFIHPGSAFYERIGVSFEFPNLYSKFSARDNLEFFSRLYTGPVRSPESLLRDVALSDWVDRRVSEFSKGMKQRLNLVRALVHNPDLIFLDEPTAGLDPVNIELVRSLIFRERERGATICLNTHDMQLAESVCDRVAFIVGGHIAVIDTPRNLKLRYGQASVKVEYEEDSRINAVSFPLEGLGNNADFHRLLQSGTVRTLHSQEAGLDQVFIACTGESL